MVRVPAQIKNKTTKLNNTKRQQGISTYRAPCYFARCNVSSAQHVDITHCSCHMGRQCNGRHTDGEEHSKPECGNVHAACKHIHHHRRSRLCAGCVYVCVCVCVHHRDWNAEWWNVCLRHSTPKHTKTRFVRRCACVSMRVLATLGVRMLGHAPCLPCTPMPRVFSSLPPSTPA